MQKILITLVAGACAAMMPALGSAKGCLKGAAVGGVAGHVAGITPLQAPPPVASFQHHREKVRPRRQRSSRRSKRTRQRRPRDSSLPVHRHRMRPLISCRRSRGGHGETIR